MPAATDQKRESRKPSSAKTTVPAPEWATQTPEILYTIEAFLGETIEQVDLTREEYIALKRHLAKMRGLPTD